MSPKEFKLVAHLLELASDHFSNHGCNDFNLLEFFTLEECIEFDKAFHEQNGDPEEHDPEIAKKGISYDWLLMSYYAEKLKTIN